MIEKALVFRDRVQSSHDNRFKLQTCDSLQKQQQHKQKKNNPKTKKKNKKNKKNRRLKCLCYESHNSYNSIFPSSLPPFHLCSSIYVMQQKLEREPWYVGKKCLSMMVNNCMPSCTIYTFVCQWQSVLFAMYCM